MSKNDNNKVWKLGSLFWCSSIDTEGEDFFNKLLTYYSAHKNLAKMMPPEDRELATRRLMRSAKEIHRRDVYAFASLLESLVYNSRRPPKLSQVILADEHEVTDFNHLIKLLIDEVQGQTPDCRPTIDAVLANNIFTNCEFLKLRKYFINFSTYDPMDKAQFFDTLIERLKRLPNEILIINLFRIIVTSRVIMSEAFIYQNVMPYFLIPKKTNKTVDKSNSDSAIVEDNENQTTPTIIPEEAPEKYMLTNGTSVTLTPLIDQMYFDSYILPYLDNLFCVHDFKIRRLLLQYLPHYGCLIDKVALRKRIMPQILLGIKDSNAEIVSLTFRALAYLVEQHGVAAVLGGSAKRDTYFPDKTTNGRDNVNIAKSTSDCTSVDNLSFVSDKSLNSESFPDFGYNAKRLAERTSPDGGEEKTRTTSIVSAATTALNLVEDDDDGGDDWGGWDTPKVVAPEPPKPKDNISNINNNIKSNGKPNKSSANSTFDIKEIDFKDYAADNNELSNLFQELEPVLQFSNKKNLTTNKSNIVDASKTNGSKAEKIEVDLNRFVAKLEPNDMITTEEGDCAWDDINLELGDDQLEDQDQEACSPVKVIVSEAIDIEQDRQTTPKILGEEISSDYENNSGSNIASEYASPLSSTPTSTKEEFDSS